MPTNMADGVSNKVEIKTEKDEIPVQYCYEESPQLKGMEKSPDTDKTKLHGELLEQCQHELQTAKEKLRKTESELEKSNKCNRELRDELERLNTELHRLKNTTTDKSDAESQTDALLLQDGFKYLDGLSKYQAIMINDPVDEGHEHQTVDPDTKLTESGDTESAETHGNKETDVDATTEGRSTVESNEKSKDNDIKMESDDKKEKEDKPEEGNSVSLADELRATAEAVVQQTGYVYDENSGLYYDYNSGYYYNAEKALYYDPNTGTYFYYNAESAKYEFHSQVDVSQYSTTQGYNYNYSQYRDHYPRGGNYDTPPRKDYYSSHRDSGYDQHHRVLPRRDRDTPRSSSKSYVDHHTSHRSDRRDSDKKKKSKRLQAEEMEYRKRKKKKKDKDKKKKKRKSSKEKRRDKSQERKGDEKCSDKKKEKSLRKRKKSEEGEVLSEDSNEKDDKIKEDDDDKTEDEDLTNYDLVGDSRSYMDELYESFDDNSNDVTSEEASTLDDLYEDLGDDNVQKCESGDNDSSKNDVKSSDHKSSENDISDMELSSNADNVNTSTNCEKTEYSKEKLNTRESSSKTNKKIKTARGKSHHNVKDKHKILHKDVVSTSDEHRTKKSRTETSDKDNQSSSSNSKSSKYYDKYRESRNPNNDFSKTPEKPHSKSGKEDRTYSASRSESSRKAKSRSYRKSSPSSSDNESDSSNSVCTGESELESGEITSSSDEEVTREEPVAMLCDDDVQDIEDVPELYGEGHTNDVIMADEEMVSKWPPCIRMIVTDSDIIDPGTLFIVTCTGATVGREKEMGHTILIPDINISKAHAEIHFDEAEYQYFLTDLASQNGTFLNEERISEPKVKSKPKALGHGDTLQFGCTRLLLHIHEGMDTCDECEPGQVQAQLQAQNQQPKEIVILSKEEKLRQQKQQLKKIKKKYGLKNSAYEDNMSAINNPSYTDKAQERRKTVGSDNPYQPDEAPASVHRPISEDNKGHKMLKKLGWSEGESLGKDNEGIRQPISVKFRANKSAGLGAGGAGEGSVEAVGDLHRRQKWLEVQQRYNQMEVDKTTANKLDKKTLTAPKWVQGETQED